MPPILADVIFTVTKLIVLINLLTFEKKFYCFYYINELVILEREGSNEKKEVNFMFFPLLNWKDAMYKLSAVSRAKKNDKKEKLVLNLRVAINRCILKFKVL